MSQSRILLVLLIIQHVNRRRFSVGYIYLLSRPSPAFRTTALPLILLRPFLPYTFTNRLMPPVPTSDLTSYPDLLFYKRIGTHPEELCKLCTDITHNFHELAVLTAARWLPGVNPLLPFHLAAVEAMRLALDRDWEKVLCDGVPG